MTQAMRKPMTPDYIPSSQELVRSTREAWKLNKAKFGERLGLTGEFAGRVEHGHQTFSDKNIIDGSVHPDPEVRAFWFAYRTARNHELDRAILEKCIEATTVG